VRIDFESGIPLYLQIAGEIENGILSGAFPEETQVPSTTEISMGYQINPATVLKGMNRLVEGGILYKKRGVGMFVKTGAAEKLRAARRRQFYETWVAGMLAEAQKLSISKGELIRMIEEGDMQNGD